MRLTRASTPSGRLDDRRPERHLARKATRTPVVRRDLKPSVSQPCKSSASSSEGHTTTSPSGFDRTSVLVGYASLSMSAYPRTDARKSARAPMRPCRRRRAGRGTPRPPAPTPKAPVPRSRRTGRRRRRAWRRRRRKRLDERLASLLGAHDMRQRFYRKRQLIFMLHKPSASGSAAETLARSSSSSLDLRGERSVRVTRLVERRPRRLAGLKARSDALSRLRFALVDLRERRGGARGLSPQGSRRRRSRGKAAVRAPPRGSR